MNSLITFNNQTLYREMAEFNFLLLLFTIWVNMLTAHVNRAYRIQFSSPTMQMPGTEHGLLGLAARADPLRISLVSVRVFQKKVLSSKTFQSLRTEPNGPKSCHDSTSLSTTHIYLESLFTVSFNSFKGLSNRQTRCLCFIFYQVTLPEIAWCTTGEANSGAQHCLILKGYTPHFWKEITTLVGRSWTSAIISYNYSYPTQASVCL